MEEVPWFEHHKDDLSSAEQEFVAAQRVIRIELRALGKQRRELVPQRLEQR
ncbi:hypothetical protein ACIHBD_01925 [Kitasatospora aureofaciens]|uniref:hypothetical protein n=1 Tax=Kitasatospora aureofaciens TaxID=1894 RepID=UPI000AE67646